MNDAWIEQALTNDATGVCTNDLDALSEDELRLVVAHATRLARELTERAACECPLCAMMEELAAKPDAREDVALLADSADDDPIELDDADVMRLDDGSELVRVDDADLPAVLAAFAAANDQQQRARALERLAAEAAARVTRARQLV